MFFLPGGLFIVCARATPGWQPTLKDRNSRMMIDAYAVQLRRWYRRFQLRLRSADTLKIIWGPLFVQLLPGLGYRETSVAYQCHQSIEGIFCPLFLTYDTI